MSAMGRMLMPGGWAMSMAWMQMPGQTWPDAAPSFLSMWFVMMMAMMLPSLIPMLRCYREAVAAKATARVAWPTAVVGLGYFSVWIMFGMAVYPLGVGLTSIEMQQPALARAVPTAVAVAVMISGAFQFTAWKARRLACCREALGCTRASINPSHGEAWRYGVRLGRHCALCCANLMSILLVVGVMDLGAMAVVTAAITIERLAPADGRAARVVGAVAVASGLFLMARATGLG
jgi:predicted metal-binding membrane protein